MSDVTFVSVADFLALVRNRPDLFSRQAIANRSRLGRTTVFAMLNPSGKSKGRVDPKLSSLQRLVHGCNAKLLIALPPSAAPDLPRDSVSRD